MLVLLDVLSSTKRCTNMCFFGTKFWPVIRSAKLQPASAGFQDRVTIRFAGSLSFSFMGC